MAAMSARGWARRRLDKLRGRWPDHSPGSVNAWLLMVTSKAPTWRDPLVVWPDDPPTVGAAHAGLFYPDPLGFWAETRRWAQLLVRQAWPDAAMAGALAVTTVLHGSDIRWARKTMRPAVILFLDEAAWAESGMAVEHPTPYAMPDPYREGTTYEGFWARLPDGTVVGKSPQHPAAHKLFRAEDIDGFLRAVPLQG